jgi:hypothetical protein
MSDTREQLVAKSREALATQGLLSDIGHGADRARTDDLLHAMPRNGSSERLTASIVASDGGCVDPRSIRSSCPRPASKRSNTMGRRAAAGRAPAPGRRRRRQVPGGPAAIDEGTRTARKDPRRARRVTAPPRVLTSICSSTVERGAYAPDDDCARTDARARQRHAGGHHPASGGSNPPGWTTERTTAGTQGGRRCVADGQAIPCAPPPSARLLKTGAGAGVVPERGCSAGVATPGQSPPAPMPRGDA